MGKALGRGGEGDLTDGCIMLPIRATVLTLTYL
jgi:hypothetical protein